MAGQRRRCSPAKMLHECRLAALRLSALIAAEITSFLTNVHNNFIVMVCSARDSELCCKYSFT